MHLHVVYFSLSQFRFHSISTLGLCQLFASERPSLQNLSVKGDIIVKPETKDGET